MLAQGTLGMNTNMQDQSKLSRRRWPILFREMRPFSPAGGVRDSLAGIEPAAMSISQALGYASYRRHASSYWTLHVVPAASRVRSIRLGQGTSWSPPIRQPPPFWPGASPAWRSWRSARYVALAGLLAMLTAGLLLLSRLLRLGFLADFLSRTVLVGFLTGVGFQVGIALLGEMLGLTRRGRLGN